MGFIVTFSIAKFAIATSTPATFTIVTFTLATARVLRTIKSRFVITIIMFMYSLACTATEHKALVETVIPLLSIQGAHWTQEEQDFIRELHKGGSIKIATKISSAVYVPQQDGSISGFHYSVLKEFADLAKINIDIKLVTWDNYFYKRGRDLEKAKSVPHYAYVPSLIESVDLYLDGITALAWREKMFDIVKYVPSRQMIVTRKDNRPNKLESLDGKVCAMIINTSMMQNLERLKKTANISFSYTLTDNFDELDKLVSQGRADFTVYDSDRAFAALKNYPNLTIAWPISDTQMMGWAIHKNNTVLKGILDKYINYAQETAILDKYWKRSYGVSFVEYLKILHLGDPSH